MPETWEEVTFANTDEAPISYLAGVAVAASA
jgi:hypothetical protein